MNRIVLQVVFTLKAFGSGMDLISFNVILMFKIAYRICVYISFFFLLIDILMINVFNIYLCFIDFLRL